jgi:hypothetical protein
MHLRAPVGLDKNIIGELLGDPDAFYLSVLDRFTGTFRCVAWLPGKHLLNHRTSGPR